MAQVSAGTCPRCGWALVVRTNSNDGSRFVGCSQFPSCRYTRDWTGEVTAHAAAPAPTSRPSRRRPLFGVAAAPTRRPRHRRPSLVRQVAGEVVAAALLIGLAYVGLANAGAIGRIVSQPIVDRMEQQAAEQRAFVDCIHGPGDPATKVATCPRTSNPAFDLRICNAAVGEAACAPLASLVPES